MSTKETDLAILEAQKDSAREQAARSKHKLEQAEHRMNRARQTASHIVGRRNKKRNSRLIQKGLAIETICEETALLEPEEFQKLAEEIFADEQLILRIGIITAGRRGPFELEQQELHDLQMELNSFRKSQKKRKRKLQKQDPVDTPDPVAKEGTSHETDQRL